MQFLDNTIALQEFLVRSLPCSALIRQIVIFGQ